MKTTAAEDRLNKIKSQATITEFEVTDVETNDYPGNFGNSEEGVWDFDKFAEKFEVDIVRSEGDELEFDLIGISPAVANAFRRILLSEIPTMAIERVEIYNNTSLFQDDFLAHRLGLIPIKVDPRLFEYPNADKSQNETDTVVFELKLKCTKEPGKGKDAEPKITNREVLTRHMKWSPIGNQTVDKFLEPLRPVHDDILIAKLSPGQELDLRLVCVKGIGRDHAKFSPVATASYRLLPKIVLLRDVKDDDADLLQESFSKGVVDVIAEKRGGKRVAKIVDARKDMCSRNIYRHEHLRDAVDMTLVKDHFIYTIESTGALAPNELMSQAIDILIGKCNSFITELQDIKR